MTIQLRAAGPLLVRASTLDCELPVLAGDPMTADLPGVTGWLDEVWSRPEVRQAITVASPLLAERVTASVAAGHHDARPVRRLARSLAMYLLRWRRRATPFGLFAGITTATVGTHSGGAITGYRAVARPDAAWLHRLADHTESIPRSRAALMVVANNLAVERDGRLLLPARCAPGEDLADHLREASIRLTRPVRAALDAATTAVRLSDLVDRLSTAFATPAPAVDAMLGVLLAQGFLASAARSAPAAVDPPPVTPPASAASPTLAVDVRLHGEVTVSEAVIREAQRAASVLLRLTTEPFGATRWLDYHARFRARYGRNVAVAIRELLSDAGLGYPTGFLDATPTRRAWRAITDRDAVLLNLLHRAATDGRDEVVLTDGDIDALTIGDHETIVPPPRCEVGFAIHAASRQALDAGGFFLRVTAAPEAATSLAGRFAHLLDPAERDLLAGYFAAPGQWPDRPIVAQLSFSALRPEADNVVRVPVLTPATIVLGQVAPDPAAARIEVDDLAVAADDEQLHLVQLSTGRRVVPVIPHALELTRHTPPLARFLAEVADARTAVYRPFDFGAARTLDHTPRIRHGRTILAPARWILHPDRLKDGAWADRLRRWRVDNHVPGQVVVASGGEHLPLDLDQALDVAILGHLARRSGRVELHEQIPGGQTWLGRPAEVLVPLVVANPPDRRPPRLLAPAPSTPPTAEGIIALRLAGNPARFDRLVADHLPRLAAQLQPIGLRRWWLRRLRDLIVPERDQYLAITLQLDRPDDVGPALAQITSFARDLAGRGLPSEVSIHPHQDHPGRYHPGTPPDTVHSVFAADSLAAVAQTRLALTGRAPAQALAAASMIAIATGLRTDGQHLLLAAVPHSPGPLDRATTTLAATLSDPTEDYGTLRAIGGDDVADAWRQRTAVLAAICPDPDPDPDPVSTLRALLRDHHARTLGVDRDIEHRTRQMARRAAQRHLARQVHR